VLRDYLLGAQIRKREARMMAEFPSIAELMALAVSAGESATGALDRVSRSARGELSKEFTRVLAETRAGKPPNGCAAGVFIPDRPRAAGPLR
jgi:tight adherence protein C